jgi:hypothetical protein
VEGVAFEQPAMSSLKNTAARVDRQDGSGFCLKHAEQREPTTEVVGLSGAAHDA